MLTNTLCFSKHPPGTWLPPRPALCLPRGSGPALLEGQFLLGSIDGQSVCGVWDGSWSLCGHCRHQASYRCCRSQLSASASVPPGMAVVSGLSTALPANVSLFQKCLHSHLSPSITTKALRKDASQFWWGESKHFQWNKALSIFAWNPLPPRFQTGTQGLENENEVNQNHQDAHTDYCPPIKALLPI
jgi:hypothetical protein